MLIKGKHINAHQRYQQKSTVYTVCNSIYVWHPDIRKEDFYGQDTQKIQSQYFSHAETREWATIAKPTYHGA